MLRVCSLNRAMGVPGIELVPDVGGEDSPYLLVELSVCFETRVLSVWRVLLLLSVSLSLCAVDLYVYVVGGV